MSYPLPFLYPSSAPAHPFLPPTPAAAIFLKPSRSFLHRRKWVGRRHTSNGLSLNSHQAETPPYRDLGEDVDKQVEHGQGDGDPAAAKAFP